jgi:hypothetical protein
MEVDWEIEVGGDAPIIDAYWPGFADLRLNPEQVHTLSETCRLPALADALIRLNGKDSPVWTSKCDVFVPDHFDTDEFDADKGAQSALACYIDLLRSGDGWVSVEDAMSACKRICQRLRAIELRQCRADLVIRQAVFSEPMARMGVTAYVTGAGENDSSAIEAVSAALDAFAKVASAPD